MFYRDMKEEELQPIDGKVCEFKYNQTTESWILYRIREDKDP